MARLPDRRVMGERDPRSVRGVPNYPTDDPVAKAAGMMGRAVSQLADTVGDIAERKVNANDQLEYARARSGFTTDAINARTEFEADQDYQTLGQRYEQRLTKGREDYAKTIRDPALRERFLLETNDDLARNRAWATDRARGLERDRGLASFQERSTEGQRLFLQAKDDDERAKMVTGYGQEVDAMAAKGWISAQDAQRLKKDWQAGTAVNYLQSLPPAERVAALKPVAVGERTKSAYEFFLSKGWTPTQAAAIVGNAMQESSLNPEAVNRGDGRDGSDSIGGFQWNADRAKRFRSYAAARGKPVNDLETQLEFFDLELRTSEGAAGDALIKAQNVDEATAAVISALRPAGWTRANPRAGHGFSNRLRNAQTVLAEYGGGERPAPAKGAEYARYLSPEQQRRLAEDAERDIARADRDAEKQMQASAAQTRTRVADDLASIERRGVELQDLTQDEVRSSLGEEAAVEWQANRVRARRIHSALDGIETLPEGEVERRLQTLEPAPGSEGYVEDMKAYERARKRANTFLEARRTDPALAAEAFPAVREARANAQYDEVDGRRSIRPESAQAVVQARLAAQDQLGISEPMAVTKSEASVLARQLRQIGEDNEEGMARFMRQLQTTYGDYADEVLAATLVHQGVRSDLSEVATDVLGRVARGQLPDPALAKRYAVASETAALEDAFAGNPPPEPEGLPRELQPPAVTGSGVRVGNRRGNLSAAGKPGEAFVTLDRPTVRAFYEARNNPDALTNLQVRTGIGQGQMKALLARFKDIDAQETKARRSAQAGQ